MTALIIDRESKNGGIGKFTRFMAKINIGLKIGND